MVVIIIWVPEQINSQRFPKFLFQSQNQKLGPVRIVVRNTDMYDGQFDGIVQHESGDQYSIVLKTLWNGSPMSSGHFEIMSDEKKGYDIDKSTVVRILILISLLYLVVRYSK